MEKRYISTCYIDRRNDLNGRLYLSSDKSIYIDFDSKGIFKNNQEIIISDRSYIILEMLIKEYNHRVSSDEIKDSLWPDPDEEYEKELDKYYSLDKEKRDKPPVDKRLAMISNSISQLRKHKIIGSLFQKLLPTRNHAGYMFLLGEGIDIKRVREYKENIEHISNLFTDIPKENLIEYINPLNDVYEETVPTQTSIPHNENFDDEETEPETTDFDKQNLKHSKAKKILSLFIPIVLVASTIIALVLGNITSFKSKNNFYHITVSNTQDMTDKDYDILEERVKIFSDGKKYSIDITESKIEFYLPISAFAENDIEYVLNAYLIRPINLYAFDSESKNPKDNIFIDRNDINEVKVLDGPIEGIDAAKYEIGTEDYKYFSVTLNDEFISKNKSKLNEYGLNFAFAQDIDNTNGFYHYYTFPQEDGKTFYILNNDLSNNFINLLEYNLTHESLSVSLTEYVIDINSKATWQNTEDAKVVGNNQCNFDDFSEGTITLSYRAYSSFSEGENLDTEKAFKQRFDVLGNKYAFGAYSDENNTFYIVKTTIDNLNLPIINVIGNYPNLVIRNKTSEYSFQYDVVNVTNGINNKISFSPKYYDDFEKEDLEKFVDSVNKSQDSTIYMFVDNMPVMSTDISNIDMNSGSVSFDKICQMENGKVVCTNITSDYAYFVDIMSTVAKTNENMENFTFEEYQFNVNNRGNLPTENQFNLKYDSYDEELIDRITELCPDAKVNVKDFSVYISLNLPIDNNLVSNSITISQQIYYTVNLENSMINNINIYLVNENDTVMERGRIFFTKDLKTSYSEGGIRVHGIFVNGRLEKYKNEFKKAIENDNFISNLNQDEYAWNFEGFNQ